MKRSLRVFGWIALLTITCALFGSRANASGIRNAELLTATVNGDGAGTDNSLFIFRCQVQVTAGDFVVEGPLVRFTTDPDEACRVEYDMVPDNTNNDFSVNPPWLGYKLCVSGTQIGAGCGAPGSFGVGQRWRWRCILGVVNNGTFTEIAVPNPGFLRVYPTGALELMPVDENFLPDKRLTPGQPGNGLRVDPADPTAANDGGSANIYTWRVRFRNTAPLLNSGMPPTFFMDRTNFEWRDLRTRFEENVLLKHIQVANSGVILVLVAPDGTKHYCPMEIDPDAPGQAGLYNATYVNGRVDPRFLNTRPNGGLLYPAANGDIWKTGVYFRFRMGPTQYIFNHGPLRGEGPFTNYGGWVPTMTAADRPFYTPPDNLPALPIGFGAGADSEFIPGNEVIGRPFANEYTSFAGPDRTRPIQWPLSFAYAPPFPLYTDVSNRAGQWKYYYMTTTDWRPPQRPGFPANFECDGIFYPDDAYGADPEAYFITFDSDTGPNPGDPSLPYLHPLIQIMLSDGGWTDDIPENGWTGTPANPLPYGNNRNSHRSRATTKTRVRFMVRAALPVPPPNPATLVRVWIDGVPHAMNLLEPQPTDPGQPPTIDWNRGVVFYYDTVFNVGQEGRHNVYFEADDGVHKSIWPRRMVDAQYPDLQAALLPAVNNPVDFGTGTVGKNYILEPFVNNRPVLLLPLLTPPSGPAGQAFTYEVNYFDKDGDEPTDGWVVIDSFPHRMTAADSNPTNFTVGGVPTGRKYRFVMNNLLDQPKHSYFFKFRDNWNSLAQYNVSTIRREWGEWITLPAGDDNGVPNSTIIGPVITSNHTPELFDPTFTYSDPAQTASTLFDFVVKYRDADNNAPQLIRVSLSPDNGVTWPAGLVFPMVKAEANNNYVSGVQYHLANRITLPPGNYRMRFEANDGIIDTVLTTVGTGPDAIQTGTAHTLTSTDGVTFFDTLGFADNPPLPRTFEWYIPKLDDPANPDLGLNIDVWVGAGANPTHLTLDLLDGNGGDYTVDRANGKIMLKATTNQPIRAWYQYKQTQGPIVKPNTPPVLTSPKAPGSDPNTNDGTLTPLAGNFSTTFTYSIKYTDADNQPPAYINVIVDTNVTIPMTLDPNTPKPVDYTRGVIYNATTTGQALGIGKHKYHFEAQDGLDIARFPLGGNDLNGPDVADIGTIKLPPFGTFIDRPIVPFPKGKSNDNYLFTVVYQSSQGLAPTAPIEVRIQATNGTTTTNVTMNPIDPIGPTEYMNGVRYQVQITAPNSGLTPGTHDITFGFQGFPASTTPLTLIVNGPPVLSQDPSAPLIDKTTASRAGDITFTVNYKDVNGDPPLRNGLNTMKLLILDSSGTVPATDINGNPVAPLDPTSSTPPAPTPADYVNGVRYQWVYPASNLNPGNYTFCFVAQDDLEDANKLPIPPGPFTVTAAAQPQLVEPGGDATNLNGTLTPLRGARSAQYTFCIKWVHADNIPPTKIQVIIDPGAPTEIKRDLTPAPGEGTDYAAGVKYCYTTAPNELASGAHTFIFQASDRLTTVTKYQSGTTPYPGPQVNFVPALANGTVYIQGTTPTFPVNNVLNPAVNGNTQSNFIFRVTYSDQDNLPPDAATGYVKVTLSTGEVIQMHAIDPNPNWAAGVTFESNPQTLTAGLNRTFHFDAFDGLDVVRLPAAGEISGLNVHNLPTLSNGTINPAAGPLSTTFTYSVVYTHLDNVAPATIEVIIDGTRHTMLRSGTGGTNYAAGVTYTYQQRFQSGGPHTYRFEATDSVNPGFIAKFPTDGSDLQGPAINAASFSPATFVPNPGVVGQPVTLTSALNTNLATAQQIAITVVKPDGTGYNTSVTTDQAGGFQFQFTPDQTGPWKIRASWAGFVQNGTVIYDPVSIDYPSLNVVGYSTTLQAGVLDLISQPLIPITPDPALTFGVTDLNDNPLPITFLDLIKWLPNLGVAGQYVSLNNSAGFPGITGGQGYWVRPQQTLKINPRGKVWQQDQVYAIPLSAGWNMFGSVFLSDINWSAVKVRVNGQIFDLAQASNIIRSIAWGYDPNTGGYTVVSNVNVIKTGRGYWIKALQPCELLLSPPGTRVATVGRDVVEREDSLQIMARAGNRADQDTFVALSGATKTRMELMEKPPYLDNYVSVRLLDPATVDMPAATRAAIHGQTVITFQVDTDRKNTDVQVMFPNLATLGRKYDVTLVDLASGASRAMGTSPSVTYNSGDQAQPRRYAVLVDNRLINSTLVINDLRAVGRANNNGLSFTYNISQAANVRAQIVSGSGAVVRDLAQGRAATRGVNTLVWDGKNSRGVSMPAGQYSIKLSATDDQGHQANAVAPVILVR